ncbi:TauD/TfdA family dioxygenase [Verticiella sediminum]|uniref:TauD/TfdA family dioxygenase n=1 Tax=Verticiella sediminum TaxID=1247510 RepID=A0A556A980_9BURK|nr:TauD/TfdA family dioxygenase [Verticiella sediminum]TSH89446.1 TauD/TfdA family dioxygenase [Verticiella sediminum]
MLNVRPLHQGFGLEILDLDLAAPHSDEVIDDMIGLLDQHSLLLVRGQRLRPERHVEISRRFGPLLTHVLKQYLTTGLPEIYVLSNVTQDGKPIGNHKEGWNWHSDLSYVAEPSMGSLLYAVEVPPVGADTLFASMHLAYDGLPPALRERIRHLRATHSYAGYYGKAFADRTPLTDEQKARTPDVVHPVVRTHPVTGRPSLYVGQDIVSRIEGLPQAEGDALLAELNAHAIDEAFVYRHVWRQGDLVLWDNRATMHCATPYDDSKYRRIMHRTTVAGSRPF